MAAVVWARLDPGQATYCEPFAGSLAVLLERPGWTPDCGWTETVNDKDGFVTNAWRAILHDPERTAHHADWPVNENDLHARHAWLVQHRDSLPGSARRALPWLSSSPFRAPPGSRT